MMNELLVEKYQTQKRLSEIANHDLVKYVADTHFRVRELSARLGLKLKYGTPGGVLQDMPAEVSNYSNLTKHNINGPVQDRQATYECDTSL